MGNAMFKRVFGRKEVRVLILGLDAAGKTTVLYQLKLGEVVTTIPTMGFNVETISYKHTDITAWDVGGRGGIRPLYRHYYANTDALVFVVDSNDRERLDESIEELERMLSEDELRWIPVAVLANKQDMPDAMTASDVASRLLERGKRIFLDRRPWCVFTTCATSGDGLYEALDWLTGMMSRAEARKYVTGGADKQTTTTTTGVAKDDNNNTNKDVSKLSYLTNSFSAIKKMFV